MSTKSSEMDANSELMKNLAEQLDRLIAQLKDVEDCKDDLDDDEYQSMKDDTLDQIKEFTSTLDRMNKGDIGLNNAFSVMRKTIRQAIAESFNTIEMIKMFGDQRASDLTQKLCELEESFKLKKIATEDYEEKKIPLLVQMRKHGLCLSQKDAKFLDSQVDNEISNELEQIADIDEQI